MDGIGQIDYYKCSCCGFVLSKTHSELPASRWSELNSRFHHCHENSLVVNNINQPPYAEQALMVAVLGANGIVNTDSMLDYAAGYGALSSILAKYYKIHLPIFDPYVKNESSLEYVNKENLSEYKTVINSAMFEHVLERNDLDLVNSIVEYDGCMIIHTVVCENIPNNPDWFYLEPPVHTAFHTNKSMGILMGQWGYRSSIYCPQSKCWVLLRDPVNKVDKVINKINIELQSNWFFCKDGFMDYWKGF